MSVVGTSFKAKELLDSLVEPLTAQVHQLPAIHAQLGLPSSAIAADLDKLRVVLSDAIEAEIQQRRSEVKGWLERCDKVERDCNVLAKSTGLDKSEDSPTSTISELRKIIVSDFGLPEALTTCDSFSRFCIDQRFCFVKNIPERLEQLVALRDSLNVVCLQLCHVNFTLSHWVLRSLGICNQVRRKECANHRTRTDFEDRRL